MCIIVIKPANKNIPDDKTLRECFKSNPDGAGIMYPVNGAVQIIKGLMTYDHFNLALQSIPDKENTTIVMHFRIGTHGKKSPENTHPFPLSGDFNDLQLLQNTCKRALVHNGIMSQYGEKNATLSDSAFFAKLLSGLKTDKAIKRALQAHVNYGKFVVLSGDSLIRIGNFTKFHGCFFSNETFRTVNRTSAVYTSKGYLISAGKYPDKYVNSGEKQTSIYDGIDEDEKFREYLKNFNLGTTE